ncbi:hypothetical protein X961_5844 [Burkholderia pseudomallei MSHR5613]|nr:hypothetical protein X961_5844 [Burkholderia pseudomallei MSHR5613]
MIDEHQPIVRVGGRREVCRRARGEGTSHSSTNWIAVVDLQRARERLPRNIGRSIGDCDRVPRVRIGANELRTGRGQAVRRMQLCRG